MLESQRELWPVGGLNEIGPVCWDVSRDLGNPMHVDCDLVRSFAYWMSTGSGSRHWWAAAEGVQLLEDSDSRLIRRLAASDTRRLLSSPALRDGRHEVGGHLGVGAKVALVDALACADERRRRRHLRATAHKGRSPTINQAAL